MYSRLSKKRVRSPELPPWKSPQFLSLGGIPEASLLPVPAYCSTHRCRPDLLHACFGFLLCELGSVWQMRLLAVMALNFFLSTQSKKILLINYANKDIVTVMVTPISVKSHFPFFILYVCLQKTA